MAAPTVYPSAKQFIGVAKEATPGTPVAMTSTLPVEKFDSEDKVTGLIDKSMRGSMVNEYAYIQGVKISDFSFSGPAYLDGIGFWLANILGDLTTTGGAAPFSHAFSTLNSGTGQPGTLTITDWQGLPLTNQARQFSGACLSELTLKGNAESELITYDAKGMGWASVIAGAIPTAAPTAALPIASWKSLLGIGGVASGGTLDSTIGNWEIKISRVLKPYFTAQNSQNPFVIMRGEVTVSGKLTFVAPATETNALLTLLNNTQPQFQWTISNGGAGATLLTLQVDVQAAAFDTSKIDRGGESVGYSSTFKGIASATNAGASGGVSPVKVTIQNAIAAGIYV
jgi:hypothetical protein